MFRSRDSRLAIRLADDNRHAGADSRLAAQPEINRIAIKELQPIIHIRNADMLAHFLALRQIVVKRLQFVRFDSAAIVRNFADEPSPVRWMLTLINPERFTASMP